MSKPGAPTWRDLYDRLAPALVVFALLSAVSAVGWSFQNSRANDHQDRQRIADAEAFNSCFDRFATALAGGLPPVREATAALNTAQGNAFEALQQLLAKVIAKDAEAADVQAAAAALGDVQTALDHLSDVRADNPYPEAPSEFCDLDLP